MIGEGGGNRQMVGNLYNLLSNKLLGMTHEQLTNGLPCELGFIIPVREGWSKRDRVNAVLGDLSCPTSAPLRQNWFN